MAKLCALEPQDLPCSQQPVDLDLQHHHEGQPAECFDTRTEPHTQTATTPSAGACKGKQAQAAAQVTSDALESKQQKKAQATVDSLKITATTPSAGGCKGKQAQAEAQVASDALETKQQRKAQVAVDSLKIKQQKQAQVAVDTLKTKQQNKAQAAVDALKIKQSRELPQILTELKRNGRKTSCWIWWVCPTEMPGACEPGPETFVTSLTYSQLFGKDACPDEWKKVLEKICDLVERDGTRILPGIDHGRVHYFLKFWKGLPGNPKWMNACLARLDKYDWS